jgi:DNA-binding NtrC family response regulator
MDSPFPDEAIRTLVVEDEPLILKLVSGALRSAGHFVGTASNGEEGLARFQEAVWDVVVTDRAMPNLSGDEMTASIKRLSPETPVILMTGLKSAVTEVSSYAAILQKPFRASHLLNAIEGCLSRPLAAREKGCDPGMNRETRAW